MKLHERYSKIFYYLCDHDSYVTAEQLSKYLSVSVRTIKKEIAGMKEILDMHGCHIESRHGLGYMLVIDDEEIYNNSKSDIVDYVKYSHSYSYAINNIMNTIVKHILFTNKSFDLYELSEMVYISQESLIKYMKKITDHLNSFNLNLTYNKNSKRYRISGKEMDLRLFAKDYIIMQLDEIMTGNFNFKDYEWTNDSISLYTIIDIVIEVAKKEKISFFEIGIYRIACYIYIMYFRNRMSIDIDKAFLHSFISDIDYDITDKLIKAFNYHYPQIIFSDIERDALALNVLSERDYTKFDLDNMLITREFLNFSSSMFYFLVQHENLSLLTIIPHERIITWLLSIMAKILSNNYKQDKPYTFFSDKSVSYSSFSYFISSLIVSYIGKEYEIYLNKFCQSFLMNCIYTNLMQIKFESKKISIGIYSFLGKLTSRTMRMIIMDSSLQHYIKDIHVFEIYKDNPKDYDLLLIHQRNETSLEIDPSKVAYFDGTNYIDSNIVYQIKAAYLNTSDYLQHLSILEEMALIEWHKPITFSSILNLYDTYDEIDKHDQIISNYNQSCAFIFVKEKHRKIFDVLITKLTHNSSKYKRIFVISTNLTSKDLIYYKTMEALAQILSRYGMSIDFTDKKGSIQFIKREIERYLVETLL